MYVTYQLHGFLILYVYVFPCMCCSVRSISEYSPSNNNSFEIVAVFKSLGIFIGVFVGSFAIGVFVGLVCALISLFVPLRVEFEKSNISVLVLLLYPAYEMKVGPGREIFLFSTFFSNV